MRSFSGKEKKLAASGGSVPKYLWQSGLGGGGEGAVVDVEEDAVGHEGWPWVRARERE